MNKGKLELRYMFIGIAVLLFIFFVLDISSSYVKVGNTMKLALDLIPMLKLPYF